MRDSNEERGEAVKEKLPFSLRDDISGTESRIEINEKAF